MQQRTFAVIFICVAFLVSACNPASDFRQTRDHSATPTSDQVRHDLEPLTKRFPEIGNPISADWMGGTLGAQSDSRAAVPGPSVYWIEAIIELEPATADGLRSKYAPAATSEQPNLKNLQTGLPAGPYLTSSALDTALSNKDWRSTAYLDGASNTLVMRSVDD
ncbi:hypothetical protein ABQF31_03515 [Mycobacterium syngnathidarum]